MLLPGSRKRQKSPKEVETPVLRHRHCGEHRNERTQPTWFTVEVVEHLGTGHGDRLPHICRAPAGDVVPDTRAVWKERQRVRKPVPGGGREAISWTWPGRPFSSGVALLCPL